MQPSILLVDGSVVVYVVSDSLSLLPLLVTDLIEEVVVWQFSKGVEWILGKLLLLLKRLFDIVEHMVRNRVKDLVFQGFLKVFLEHCVQGLDSVVFFSLSFQNVKLFSKEAVHFIIADLNLVAFFLVLNSNSKGFFIFNIPFLWVLLESFPLFSKLLISNLSIFDIIVVEFYQQGSIFLFLGEGIWIKHSLEKRTLRILASLFSVQLGLFLVERIKVLLVCLVLLGVVQILQKHLLVLRLVVSHIHILEVLSISFPLVNVFYKGVSLSLHFCHAFFAWVLCKLVNLSSLQSTKFLSKSLLSNQLLELMVPVENWSRQLYSPPRSISLFTHFLKLS